MVSGDTPDDLGLSQEEEPSTVTESGEEISLPPLPSDDVPPVPAPIALSTMGDTDSSAVLESPELSASDSFQQENPETETVSSEETATSPSIDGSMEPVLMSEVSTSSATEVSEKPVTQDSMSEEVEPSTVTQASEDVGASVEVGESVIGGFTVLADLAPTATRVRGEEADPDSVVALGDATEGSDLYKVGVAEQTAEEKNSTVTALGDDGDSLIGLGVKPESTSGDFSTVSVGEGSTISSGPPAPNPDLIADQISEHDSMMGKLQEESSYPKSIETEALPQITDATFSELHDLQAIAAPGLAEVPEQKSDPKIAIYDDGSGLSGRHFMSSPGTGSFGGSGGGSNIAQVEGDPSQEGGDSGVELFDNLGVAHGGTMAGGEKGAREGGGSSQDLWQQEGSVIIKSSEEEDDGDYRPQLGAGQTKIRQNLPSSDQDSGQNIKVLWEKYKSSLIMGGIGVASLGVALYLVGGVESLSQLPQSAMQSLQKIMGGQEEDAGYDSDFDDEEDFDDGYDGEEDMEDDASYADSDSGFDSDSSSQEADESEDVASASTLTSSKVITRSQVLGGDNNPYTPLPTRENKAYSNMVAQEDLETWSTEEIQRRENSPILWHRYELVDYMRSHRLQDSRSSATLWKWIEKNEKLWLSMEALSFLLASGKVVTMSQLKKVLDGHPAQLVAKWSKRFRSASFRRGDKSLLRMLIHLGNGSVRYQALRTLLHSPDTLSRAYITACTLDPYPTIARACEGWSRRVSSYSERIRFEKVARGEESYM